MGKKPSGNHSTSNGGRKKSNLAHEAKRQAAFAKRRENGTAYKYTPNPYEPGTKEYALEARDRAEKNVAYSRDLPYTKMQRIMAHLANDLAKEKQAMKVKGIPRKQVIEE